MIEICLGIVLVAFLPVLPSIWLLLVVVCISLILWLYFPRNKFILRTVYLLMAIAYACVWGYWNLAHRLAPADSPLDVQVSGVVVALPKVASKSIRFKFAVEALVLADGSSAERYPALRKLQLTWYNPTQSIEPGQRWHFSVRLKSPGGLSNPGGFDYAGWLFRQQIDAVGYVTDKKIPQQSPADQVSIDRMRFKLIALLDRTGLSASSVATLRALILGDKSALNASQWQLLKNSGTVHLIVISGLHIGIACLLGYFLGMLLQAVVGRLRPASSDLRVLRVIPALLFATGYAALAGFSIPTQRALIMAIMLLIPPLFNLMPSLWQRWWLALTVVLILQPLSINQPGLWLSFTAVAALLLIYQSGSNTGRWSKVYQILLSQRAIFIALLPLLVLFTGGFSIWAPLINLLAIPYVSFILLPASLLLLVMLPLYPDFVVFILDALIWGFWNGLDLVAGGQALIVVPHRPTWVAVVASVGALLLVLPRLVFFRLLGGFLLLPLIKPVSPLPENGMFRAWVFDVGQGVSVMVQTRDHLLLYDTGAGFRAGGGIALYSVIPAMQSMGVRRIDRLVISHADNDHAGGYSVIADAFEIESLESGSPKWRRRNTANACDSGQSWHWDGVAFKYVHPEKAVVKSENNSSCVLLVESAGCSLLIPGDVESVVEHQILDESPQLNVDWLIASHHGSRFSTDQHWLQKLDPQAVIFSAGLGNSYGHPAAEVVSRVEAQGSRWFSTASAGAVLLEENAGGCNSSAYRDQKKRYWSDG